MMLQEIYKQANGHRLIDRSTCVFRAHPAYVRVLANRRRCRQKPATFPLASKESHLEIKSCFSHSSYCLVVTFKPTSHKSK
jgi:hypothetical protein